MRVSEIYYLPSLNQNLTKDKTRTREIQMDPDIFLQKPLRQVLGQVQHLLSLADCIILKGICTFSDVVCIGDQRNVG